MMLHHAARRAAGAAGVDKAGGILARHREPARLRVRQMRLAAFDQRRPVVNRHLALLADAQAFHADDDTLAEQIIAAEAAMANAAAREAVMFQSGSDAYVLISAADGLSANDSLIKLTGIDTTATTSDVLTLDTGNLIIT